MRWFFLLSLFFTWRNVEAQTCTTLGQNPSTAFPVCGTSVFFQTNVPICGGRTVPVPCAGTVFTDKNPFWYRFTCFSSGTLGFTITPLTISEDYDWQLFDITGQNPNDVFNNSSLFVACNWSGEGGNTGASPAGNRLIECDGPGVPLFSAMPQIIQGRTYLLLVSHFSDSQSGYNLSFGGGTASITDPTDPHLLSAAAACDGTLVSIKLNKKMKCSTLAANGSDFTLSSPLATIISATGVNCNAGFDMDSITLQLSNPLPPGNYTVSIKNGTDGNTLLDNCDRAIPPGDVLPVTVLPLQPTPMDSLVPVKCSPQILELVFSKNIRCNSIAGDGSDFTVTGTYPVTVSGAAGTCSAEGLTKRITIQLSAPLQRAGNFTITLKTGSDGNTLIDECGQSTPAGSILPFSVKDTVNADFTFSVRYGCSIDTVNFSHNGANGVNTWTWNFDGTRQSQEQDPVLYYSVFGIKNVQLIVSNGVCSDTSQVQFNLDNALDAAFSGPDVVCPDDKVKFTDQSTGEVISWMWNFGNGITSNQEEPPLQEYIAPNANTSVLVRLTVSNAAGCTSTEEKLIPLVNNCYIDVPSAFTPNGDGLNDFLYPLNAYKARTLSFNVYNRFGQRIFSTTNWLNKWDGKFNGREVDPGTYVWMLSYFDSSEAKSVFKKGTVVLIR